MTPEQKAQELFNHYGKDTAIIVVDAVIDLTNSPKGTVNPAWYWEEVKEEIQKINQ